MAGINPALYAFRQPFDGLCLVPWLAVVVEVDDAFEQHVAQIVHAVFVECAVFGHEV